MPGAIKVGPWGGDDGATKDSGAAVQITTIQVHAGEVLDAIKITYKKDGAGPAQTYTIGGPAVIPSRRQIYLPEGQYITSVSGKTVEYRGHRRFSALSFLTNDGLPHGPYGRKYPCEP